MCGLDFSGTGADSGGSGGSGASGVDDSFDSPDIVAADISFEEAVSGLGLPNPPAQPAEAQDEADRSATINALPAELQSAPLGDQLAFFSNMPTPAPPPNDPEPGTGERSAANDLGDVGREASRQGDEITEALVAEILSAVGAETDDAKEVLAEILGKEPDVEPNAVPSVQAPVARTGQQPSRTTAFSPSALSDTQVARGLIGLLALLGAARANKTAVATGPTVQRSTLVYDREAIDREVIAAGLRSEGIYVPPGAEIPHSSAGR